MKSGVNYGIFVRFPIKKKSNIHIIGGLGYDDFSNSASYNDSTGAADFTLKQSVLGVTLGAEYDFYSKKSKFMPFVGAEMMLSIFGGKLIIDEPTESRELKMNTTSRFGFQLGAGVDWIFHNNLGLVLGAKYTYANLFGKEFIEDKGTKYNLNDGEHTSNGVDYPEKKVRYIHFYAALAFYFGR
jgi:opacity protein-like surface antigen